MSESRRLSSSPPAEVQGTVPVEPASSITSIPKLYKRELPDSQESFVSTASSTFAVPTLLPSSSNVSNSTGAGTEFTSPSTSTLPSSQSQPRARVDPPSPSQVRVQDARAHAPRLDTTAPQTGDTTASPMFIDSPVFAQGAKRTADGAVKDMSLTGNAGPATAAGQGHKRTKSTESGSNSRIGEVRLLSAQLRTRLSYAMVKVQNGWEKQSLEELEEQTSQRGSPVSVNARSDGSRPMFDSPRTSDRPRRPSGVSDNSDQMMMSPGQVHTPFPRNIAPLTLSAAFWHSGPKPPLSGMTNGMAATTTGYGPVLAPAPEIGPRRKRRSSASHAPPPLLGSSQRKHYSDLSGTPRTPITTPRPGILRMPSQQAEKDAVDTLLFMSSPNNTGRLPHTSMDTQAHPSPLRPEVSAPRRVMFDTNSLKPNEHRYPPSAMKKEGHHVAHYRSDGAR
ncbi:hypothetical protein EJ04DRAFT_596143 [Polyplosphaeria fusca]|uniref:Uncharacterized protein n=1 Tax=Polyplosphaeria fusca TaxID=682080 RepID=A0A9P4V1V7_9PLEO|nr:hypothetical protein EJ04DRAFT_596143 [Polyplosphaeria fusca]